MLGTRQASQQTSGTDPPDHSIAFDKPGASGFVPILRQNPHTESIGQRRDISPRVEGGPPGGRCDNNTPGDCVASACRHWGVGDRAAPGSVTRSLLLRRPRRVAVCGPLNKSASTLSYLSRLVQFQVIGALRTDVMAALKSLD